MRDCRHPLLALVIAPLALVACSSDDASPTPNGSSGASGASGEALFAELPEPTPNTLRGVWSSTNEDAGATVELRVRFTDGQVLSGARCASAGGTAVVASGKSLSLQTSALDMQSGSITFDAVTVNEEKNGVRCAATFPGGTYEFLIYGSKVNLKKADAEVLFQKVGD